MTFPIFAAAYIFSSCLTRVSDHRIWTKLTPQRVQWCHRGLFLSLALSNLLMYVWALHSDVWLRTFILQPPEVVSLAVLTRCAHLQASPSVSEKASLDTGLLWLLCLAWRSKNALFGSPGIWDIEVNLELFASLYLAARGPVWHLSSPKDVDSSPDMLLLP